MDVALWPLNIGSENSSGSLNPCCNGCSSLTLHISSISISVIIVLILVVMDVALWPVRVCSCPICCRSRLNPCCNGCSSLTLLDVAGVGVDCLNPCCNGCSSLTKCSLLVAPRGASLNPCCNGCSSLTINKVAVDMYGKVLILVVMDVALWHKVHVTEYTKIES